MAIVDCDTRPKEKPALRTHRLAGLAVHTAHSRELECALRISKIAVSAACPLRTGRLDGFFPGTLMNLSTQLPFWRRSHKSFWLLIRPCCVVGVLFTCIRSGHDLRSDRYL
jgi:hypothetical protein